MTALGRIYGVLLKTDLAVMMQYRAAMLIYLIGGVLQPVVYLVVWLTVAEARGGTVGDFDKGELAAYYIAFMLVSHVTFDWHMFEMGWRVRSGSLSPILLQPLHPLHRDLSENVSYKLLTLSVMVPVAALLVWFFEPEFPASAWAWGAFLPALVLAFLVRFLVEWTVALLAFWITDTSGLNQAYYIAVTLLAGRMAPLSLMPEWVQNVAALLPFKWMVAFPVELLLGRLTPREAIDGFIAQGAWLVLALALLSLSWSRAVKRYSAVGA